MIKRFCCVVILAVSGGPVFAEGEAAGTFDYYVLALSWTPSWCEEAGDARAAVQCESDAGYGFAVHGLWPQYEAGWPSFCRTGMRDPSRGQTAAMADIMGSGGSAWYQWKKHGRCTGLAATAYFATVRRAYETVMRPAVFRRLPTGVKLPANVVEAAFLEANPRFTADGVTVTCKQGRIQEVRICLGKDLSPRVCGGDVVQDCTLQDAIMDPIR